jgi:hypothetical protein
VLRTFAVCAEQNFLCFMLSGQRSCGSKLSDRGTTYPLQCCRPAEMRVDNRGMCCKAHKDSRKGHELLERGRAVLQEGVRMAMSFRPYSLISFESSARRR